MQLLLLLSLLFSSISHAEQYNGVAAFAIQHPGFPCEKYIKSLSYASRPGIAFLYRTFGTDKKCLKKARKSVESRPNLLVVYLTNESCRRFNRCDQGEFRTDLNKTEYSQKLINKDKQLIRDVRRRVKSVQKFIEPVHPNTRVVLMAGLEDDFTTSSASSLVSIIRQVWPYEIGRNPVFSGSKSGADVLELHGVPHSIPEGAFWSGDGNRFSRAEWKKLFKRYDNGSPFLWFCEMQGICDHPGGFVKPRNRVFDFSGENLYIAKKVLK